MFRLDTTRFVIDTPRLDYQPLPWVGIHQADIRGEATYARWEQIAKYLPQQHGKSALDIGSCYGFFSIKMAERGYDVIGVDTNPRHIRIARYAVPRGLRNHCNFLEKEFTPGNIDFLPPVDYTLFLSVWHHWVYNFGLPDATAMLISVWNKTRGAIYFESGEGEVIEEFKLPFNADNARQWLQAYLEKTCGGSIVRIISEHEAGKYGHYTAMKTSRALFMILRQCERN
jgi:SAM-dependent methyltransferase